MRRINLIVCASIFFLHSNFLHAQSTAGSLVGQVTDSSGAVMSGVSVGAVEIDTNQGRNATTNESGNYWFPNLGPGEYRVEFTHDGFKTIVRGDVQMVVNGTIRLDIEMDPGALSEIVDVTFSVPL